ncbi:hypothetical protein BGZ96_006589 [Linnemannia gamsii]|uniref:MICOS complex subunit n=1 Tax=Linnemannia gamsii TaxID=64522 RepID=A0ABQ7KF33_9FUNG|nr:hypothetical protein BGZ96_006589 [Linnemannia gamsii]
MVVHLLRPMSIAVATSLVAGGAFTSYTTVYADEYNRNDEREYDHRHHRRRHDDDDDDNDDSYDEKDNRVARYRPSPAHERHQFSNRHSLVANEEQLLPGLLYVALAGLSGSLVARQRNILFRMFSPLAFAAAAGAYVLPHTTHVIIDSIGGPVQSTCPQHPEGFSKPGWAPLPSTSSTSPSSMTNAVGEKVRASKGEMGARARDAWHSAEAGADSARGEVEEGAKRAKQWGGRQLGEARGAMEDMRDSARGHLRDAQDGMEHHLHHDGVGHRRMMSDSDSKWFHYTDAKDEADKAMRKTRHWSNSKSSEAEDALDNMKSRARTAHRDAQRWGDEKYSEAEDKFHEAESHASDAKRDAKRWGNEKYSEAESKLRETESRASDAKRDAQRWGNEKYSEAESKLHEAEGKAKDVSKDVKSWWFSRSKDVEDKVHEVEGKAKEAGEKAKEVSEDAKHWWNKHAPEVEDKLHEVHGKAKEAGEKAKEVSKDAKHWWNKHAPEVEDKLHEAGEKAQEAGEKAKDATMEVKTWWNKHAPEVQDKLHDATEKAKDVSLQATATLSTLKDKSKDTLHDLKDKSHDVKHWVEEKAHEAEKVAEDVAHKAKDLVDETTASIDKRLEESAQEDEEWWTIQAAKEQMLQHERLSKERKGAGKHWYSIRHSDSKEHWSTGEEMGSAKMHEHDFDHRYRNPGPFHNAAAHMSTYTNSDSYMDGLLDDNDVTDHWSSTKEEIGSSRLEGPSPTAYHTSGTSHISGTGDDYALYGFHPREREYWSNGEEMSSASVRDSTYYNYPGSFAGSSLGRTSWWSTRRSAIDHDKEMNSLRDKAESLVWETKQASERAALDMANKLAAETAMLEKSAALARVRAEEAARLAKAQSEALIRDRQAAIDRAAKEMEVRFALEKEAAEHAAAETKRKAQAWELEQRQWAEQSAKEVQERVLREKLAAEESAARLKARAEAWAHEQKERADLAAKEIHDHVVHETAAAEKLAREAKAALEFKIQQEKFKVEQTARGIQERIHLEKLKEEEAQATLRARAETLAREEKLKMEKAAREWEERLSLERAAKAVDEAKIRMEAELLAKKREVEKRVAKEKADRLALERAQADALEAKRRAAKNLPDSTAYNNATTETKSSGSGWSWPWSAKSYGTEVLTEKVPTKSAMQTHDRDHSGDSGFDSTPHLLEHIAEDIKQTKDDISVGLHHLKDSVFSGIPKAGANTRESVKETRFTSSPSGQHGVEHLKDTVGGVAESVAKEAKEAKKDAQGWWSYRTKDAERKIRGLESELQSGLNKTDEKLKEMGQEAAESDTEFWQKRAQQERRESGRAM